jgi:hypothetical protein
MNYLHKILNDKNSIIGSMVGGGVSFMKAFFTHIDGWAILQSVICAVASYFAVYFFSHYFPKKNETK